MAVIRTRTCVACGRTSSKGELVRFVRLGEGEVALDPTGRKAGRGAYLCLDQACFDVARRKRLLERALRTKVDQSAYDVLGHDFESLRESRGASSWDR